MFGSKLRSWMEAVRPRKKHEKRKEKEKNGTHKIGCFSKNNITEDKYDIQNNKKIPTSCTKTSFNGPTPSRYSAANLSSPESAYSTGYSTDGTSPGAPPDYFTKGPKFESKQVVVATLEPPPKLPPKPSTPKPELRTPTKNINTIAEMASPRQRNRIRTNPWLSTTTTVVVEKPKASPRPVLKRPMIVLADAPFVDFTQKTKSQCLVPSPLACRRKSISSSTCSSLSGTSFWEPSEEDCTLNEMMGKYDESYVYEKETDILSDSDPTDLDTDIDTGQDGGDEEDTQEGELDFIDDGSYAESGTGEAGRNTGHCSYFNYHNQRKISRRRNTRKHKHRGSSHNKKSHLHHKIDPLDPKLPSYDGSRSAGATPLFARRCQKLPISKLALEDNLRKRSNSVHFYRDPVCSSIDRRDKEAERKYEELIGEADQLLRNFKTEGLSPRRHPVGPANKRVELLRSAECPTIKARLMGDIPSSFNNTSIPRPIIKTPLLSSRSPVGARKADRRSPKHKRKTSKYKIDFNTSSSEDEHPRLRAPPQSAPVRRKIYTPNNRTVAFHPSCNMPRQVYRNSAESLRHQVLLNTIANLKRSLEDQSASLKQAYNTSQQHIPLCM